MERRIQQGDTVKIISNLSELQRLQKGHGGFLPQMVTAAGACGRVVEVDSDGDLKVSMNDGNSWVFNPRCCSKHENDLAVAIIQQPTQRDDNNDENVIATDALTRLAVLGIIMAMQSSRSGLDPSDLVREAALGNVDNVRTILRRHPDQVNTTIRSITALHVAALKGHHEIVTVLLSAGAKIEMTDEDGDTAIHFATNGNKPAILRILLENSLLAINRGNKNGTTALHVAAFKEYAECVQVLLHYSADVQKQDIVGDTALHDALVKDSFAIALQLLATRRCRLDLKNAKGFNALHHAALHNSSRCLKVMLPMAMELVNSTKSDGFTPLQIAALNGYVASATVLIEMGHADLEIVNSCSHTALLVAISRGQIPMIELLTEKGANLEVVDNDGDTPLHNVLLLYKRSTWQPENFVTQLLDAIFEAQPTRNIEKAPRINQLYRQLGSRGTAMGWLAVACYLVGSGADLNHRNKVKKSPLDEVSVTAVRTLLNSCKPRCGLRTTRGSRDESTSCCLLM